MANYQHILLALDFGPGHEQVVARATDIVQAEHARLSLIHVVEFLHVDLANELVLPQDVALENQIMATARRKLARIASEIGSLESIGQWVELGSTKQEIIRIAEQEQVDLIVIGSHGRHGLGRLLGATANAVLHGAPCDVLAVRIRPEA